MCLFRWRGVHGAERVDDADARLVQVARTLTGSPAGLKPLSVTYVPVPSKRTWLIASVLLTYSVPLAGLTTMLKLIVPTPAMLRTSASVVFEIAKTS